MICLCVVIEVMLADRVECGLGGGFGGFAGRVLDGGRYGGIVLDDEIHMAFFVQGERFDVTVPLGDKLRVCVCGGFPARHGDLNAVGHFGLSQVAVGSSVAGPVPVDAPVGGGVAFEVVISDWREGVELPAQFTFCGAGDVVVNDLGIRDADFLNAGDGRL